MRDVLITGASGFSGTALTERLAQEKDVRLFALSRGTPANPWRFQGIFQFDLNDPAAIEGVLREIKPAWIFHLAGRLKGEFTELMQANFGNTIHLLEAAVQIVPNARILLIGSAAEYGTPANDSAITETAECRPQTPYGISKYAMTLLGLRFASQKNLEINIARTFNLIGPGIPSTLLLGAVLERTREAIATGRDSIQVGDLSAERDFIDVRDAVEAYLGIMASNRSGEVFNVCSGIPVKMERLVETALSHSGRPLRYEIDARFGSSGARRVIGNPSKLERLGFSRQFPFEKSVKDSYGGILAGGKRLPENGIK
jgi:nucleoside-diphosphate-sugar epimerase